MAIDMDSSTTTITGVPDVKQSCYSYIVLASVFLNLVLIIGFMKGTGTFFVEWQLDFDVDARTVSWIGAILGLMIPVSAYFGGILLSTFYCRTVTVCGGILIFVSICVSSFTKQIWQLYILSAFQGLGIGMVFMCSITVVNYYFTQNIGLANGVGYSGSGIGIIVMPPLIEKLSDRFKWQGALLVTSSLMFIVIVSGILFIPTPKETFLLRKKKRANQYDELKSVEAGEDELMIAENTAIRRSLMSRIFSLLGMDLLFTNVDLLLLAIAYGFFGFGYFSSLTFFSSLVVFDVGLSKRDAAFLTASIGIGSVIGRLGHGILIDKKILRAISLMCCSCFLASISNFVIPSMNSFVPLFICAVWFGVFSGVANSVIAMCVRMWCEPKDFTRGLGACYLLNGIGICAGVVAMGYLHDAFDSYDVAFYTGGAAFLVSGLLTLIDITRLKRRSSASAEGTTSDI